MKRSPLKRKTGMSRSPLAARAPKWLQRSTKIRAVNSKRSRAKHGTNYGAEGVAVRSMPCLVDAAATASGKSDRELEAAGWSPCGGSIVAAHLLGARGMGGCGEFAHRLGTGPLCDAHHAESGERRGTKREAFEALYSIDCEAEAYRIALSHEPPLGVRGLAARWGYHEAGMPAYGELSLWLETTETPAGYDLAALLGWVRRRMAAEVIARCDLRLGKPSWPSYRPGDDWDGLEDNDQSALSFAVGGDLGGVFQGPESDELDGGQALTEALCELAGWPS